MWLSARRDLLLDSCVNECAIEENNKFDIGETNTAARMRTNSDEWVLHLSHYGCERVTCELVIAIMLKKKMFERRLEHLLLIIRCNILIAINPRPLSSMWWLARSSVIQRHIREDLFHTETRHVFNAMKYENSLEFFTATVTGIINWIILVNAGLQIWREFIHNRQFWLHWRGEIP